MEISSEVRALILEDAGRLLLALNALSLHNDYYQPIAERLESGFISDAVITAEIFYGDGKISEENYRAIMFILSRCHRLEEVA